jgi:hypothetical protein
MDWQQAVSLAIVVLTTVLLVRDRVRARQRRKKTLCGGACHCAHVALSIDHLPISRVQEYTRNTELAPR